MRRPLRAWYLILGICCVLGSALAQEEERKPCVPQRVLVKFRSPLLYLHAERVAASWGAHVTGGIPQIGVLSLQIPPGVDEKTYADALSQYGAVEFAEPDYIAEPCQTVTPNDPRYNLANMEGWHLARIGCPAAWARTRGHPRVIIAHIDTGVDPNHPDLVGKLVPGWNFYDNNDNTYDYHGHGTSTAGVLAAATNNVTGIASVAWNCRIMPLRISIPGGGGSSGGAAHALVWAADRGARIAVINYSFSQSTAVRTAAEYFMRRARGVVVVSAGNGRYYERNPDNPYVITVSALGLQPEEQMASWSSYGNDVDLCAPGESITTTGTNGGYANGVGTSFSAPIVAGVAALVISANPSLSGEQVQRILFRSANDLGESGWDPFHGWGCVNAARAVALARWLPMDTQPPSVNFIEPGDGSTVSGRVTIRVNAADRSGVYRVRLFVNESRVAARFTAPYTFWWDSRSVPNGIATLKVEIQDGAGNIARTSINVVVNN